MKMTIKSAFFALAGLLISSPCAFGADSKEEDFQPEQFVGYRQTYFDEGLLVKTLTGELRLAHNSENQKFAIKLANSHSPKDPHIKENPQTELRILYHLAKLNNEYGAEHVVRLQDYRESENLIWIAIPFANGGDALEYLVKSGGLSPETSQALFCDLVLGLNFLHQNNIAHLDLSLENCLIHLDENNQSCKLIIADMGLAQFTNGKPLAGKDLHHGKIGYIAPEIFYGDPQCNPKAIDVWAAGICLYILITQKIPVEQASKKCPRYQIIRHQGVEELLTWDARNLSNKPSPSCVALMKDLIRTNPLNRLTTEEILRSDFVDAEQTRRLKKLLKPSLKQ